MVYVPASGGDEQQKEDVHREEDPARCLEEVAHVVGAMRGLGQTHVLVGNRVVRRDAHEAADFRTSVEVVPCFVHAGEYEAEEEDDENEADQEGNQ